MTEIQLNTIYNEECLQGMQRIPDKSVDMILCDLPYGTTRNKWDSIIPLDKLWQQYERVIKDNGAIVLTAQTPFDKVLGVSNLKILRYKWVWEKGRPTGHLNSKKMPLKKHENILVFYKKAPQYFPQGVFELGKPKEVSRGKGTFNYGKEASNTTLQRYSGFPTSILKFPSAGVSAHPTQKPVALFEYLIKTYTSEGETVLDNCMGSGTTAIACLNTNRNYIGFELDAEYHAASLQRIAEHKQQLQEVSADE